MIKYYTRACNFYYGNQAKDLIKNNKALSLCGYKGIAFDNLEIFTRENRKIKSKIIHIRNIKKLHLSQKKNKRRFKKNYLQKKKFFEKYKFFKSNNHGNIKFNSG